MSSWIHNCWIFNNLNEIFLVIYWISIRTWCVCSLKCICQASSLVLQECVDQSERLNVGTMVKVSWCCGGGGEDNFAVSIWHVGSRLIVQGATNPCRHYISASESRVWVRARCGGNVAWRAPYITIYIASTSSLHQPVAIFVLHNPSSAPHHTDYSQIEASASWDMLSLIRI